MKGRENNSSIRAETIPHGYIELWFQAQESVWFDLPLEVGLARKGYVYNPKTLDYYREVERGYKILYSENHDRHWRRVDATLPLGVIEGEVWSIVAEELNKKG